jgi:lipopolysaccharide/colanic/teichoic acid biosynthesis glycosyltransferase
VKRGFDVIVSGALLLLLAPLVAALALLVVTSSRGPALHRAARVGRGGHEFTMYKFRTMRAGAASAGPAITGRDDPRITSFGRALRSTRLDELPQLWNVLRGDMSLVGPRPEDPRFVANYSPADLEVLSVRPGITGSTQLAHRDEEQRLPADDPEAAYVRDILPRKIAMDLAYVRGRSFVGDVLILIRTVGAALRPN